MSARLGRFGTISVDAEIHISDIHEELEGAGWHHEDNCPVPPMLTPGGPTLPDFREALSSLHRQAHPGSHPDPFMCHDEPCRSLPVDVLVPKIGRSASRT